MAVLRTVSRILIGLVFTFSGFVKCVDPLGTMHKFHDYLSEGFGLDSLVWIALPAAILMCAIELSVGLMLLLNIKIPWASWLALIFMVVFTPVTLFLALTNAVSDCGCFGDALILTNWQTFYKNILIDIFVIILFINRQNYKELFGKRNSIYAALMVFILVLGFETFSLTRLPIIDFRAYKIGANIPEGMSIPDDAPQAVYETTLIYEKDGVTKEFTVENYPKEGWEFVDSENKVIQKGYEPPIHDFSIILDDGDYTDDILSDENYVFLMISYKLEKASQKNQAEINALATKLRDAGYTFICLTSSGPDVIAKYKGETGADFEFGSSDQTTLKTIIRSNPGLMLIKKGTIIDKWHHRHLPNADKLLERLNSPTY